MRRISEDETWAREASQSEAGIAFALRARTRVLVESAAKRMIVTLHSAVPTTPGVPHLATCAHDHSRYPCLTLRAIALAYADHPEFREEWRV